MDETDEAAAADAIGAGESNTAAGRPGRKPAAKKSPPKAASTASLINKMLKVLTRRLETMVNRPTAADKEIQQLASMTKTLDQLIEMKKAEKAGKTKPGQRRTTKELADLRKKIAERIEQLNRD